MMMHRPKFGYYGQPSKSLLTVREELVETGKIIVNNRKANIAADGKKHLSHNRFRVFEEGFVRSNVTV